MRLLFNNNNEEKKLLRGLRNNKPDAQRQLYNLYAGKMMALCMRYAKSREEAEDMLQDGFLRVFRKIDMYSENGSLEGWIRRVITNVAIRHYQKNSRLHVVMDLEEAEYLVSEEAVDQYFATEDLVGMIRRLPDGYRMVFNLFAIEGYSHEEIAEKLEISVGTSKSQLSRARAALKKMVEAEVAAERKEIVNG